MAKRFRQQERFAAEYSPLYSHLFGAAAHWLEDEKENNPFAAWLLRASENRETFDVPLLLLAGVHKALLAAHPAASLLVPYFSTVGGTASPDKKLVDLFGEVVQSLADELATFIQGALVQTNESARGLCWLLPACFSGWEDIHLVELGASAGLNLVADKRHYHLVSRFDPRVYRDPPWSEEFGTGETGQFVVTSLNEMPFCEESKLSRIVSRIAGDIVPFLLKTREDELALSAFVWGDQPERLAMLQKGIEALREVNKGSVPVQQAAVKLPGELASFLQRHASPPDKVPLLVYNTYLYQYLPDKGATMLPQMASWARNQARTVLWLQWERLPEMNKPSMLGWLAWTADIWHKDRHEHFHLAWVHPHGNAVKWLDGIFALLEYWGH